MACWHALVSTARACASSHGGRGRKCVALAAHAEEREGQIRANDESYIVARAKYRGAQRPSLGESLNILINKIKDKNPET